MQIQVKLVIYDDDLCLYRNTKSPDANGPGIKKYGKD
jgi:hypothetical protein